MSTTAIHIEDVNKIYKASDGREVQALTHINLDVKKSEFISIIGPSGCGKSTLLRILANLDTPSTGKITWENSADNIGFVFQDATLLPWKTVYQNAKFPLEVKKLDTPANLENLDKLLELAGLKGFEKAYPRELSGGMRQRVAIVRALSYNPDVLLMDEPFGALDALTRDKMGLELLRIWTETQKTILFVTHSISEAAFLSDRVIVMSPRPGKIDEIIDIQLPHPRTVEVKETIEFVNYVKKLREVLG
ncbi:MULTISPECIES: ABC transporter ATP-binding protein [Paenibacillus]|uniref:ABC transporter ATP-binding protein n=1 Tax=Paenibacillus baimaensis TaxID=2982185 RepID=A0ABT2U8Q0_9BACL|nr:MULTISPECIES: ABC transporter ATP-binding protein [unclassified Paenibacillus]MCU6791013.1 ABC transporter ATP-binding protein [Paenibacillus sp. WQ 127069]OMF20956.1 ABC transporter [Paenibacillus sp. FSL H7-0331]